MTKMGWIVGLTRIILFLVIQGQWVNVAASELKNASDFAIINRDWDIKNNFCRLCAHTSEDIYPISFRVVILTAQHWKFRYSFR